MDPYVVLFFCIRSIKQYFLLLKVEIIPGFASDGVLFLFIALMQI